MQTQELQIKIGKKLKELRAVHGWTQEDVSKQLYMCRNTYSDIELGKTDICLSRLTQLANFYHVDIDYFISEKEKVVFYLTGNNNTHATNRVEKQCNEYHGNFEEEKLKNELEKQQIIIESKNKEIFMQQREIENLKEIIALLKTQPQ